MPPAPPPPPPSLEAQPAPPPPPTASRRTRRAVASVNVPLAERTCTSSPPVRVSASLPETEGVKAAVVAKGDAVIVIGRAAWPSFSASRTIV